MFPSRDNDVVKVEVDFCLCTWYQKNASSSHQERVTRPANCGNSRLAQVHPAPAPLFSRMAAPRCTTLPPLKAAGPGPGQGHARGNGDVGGSSNVWIPQHHRDITLGRLEGFQAAGQFSDRNMRADLWSRRCPDGVSLEVYSHPKDVPYPTYDEAIRMPYRPAKVGDMFGPSWTTHWFRIRARVPDGWDGLGPLMFRWDSGSEAMLYTDGATPRQGITDQRNEYQLMEKATGGQELLFYVEMAANGMFGNGPSDIQPPDENRYFSLKTAELAIPNVPVTALWYDMRALMGLARELPPGNATGEIALYTANKIINNYRQGDPDCVAECRTMAAEVLAVRDPGERMQVYAVGHCHIDTAWLWPFSETHRKTARSWSSQLRLTERFPWHVFTASSAQQYEWLQQDYPGLFSEIQGAATRGNFVPVGGTWVEMDTNLPSGESLVRQFLYGQRYFEANFGSRCDVFWLPDTFGYSGQLPQIANGAGIRYFLTQKLSWNNINSFPHSTFLWAGLDGSTLLTHFPPANTYNAQADAHDILLTATGSKDKDRAPAAYMLYGNGDGGGGPTVEMCESLSRLAGCRGLASVSTVAPGEFFRRLEAVSRDLLTWRGELYFELHRGTYTSHAANKALNRSCELLLREVEAAGALAAALLPPDQYRYPRAEVDAIWKDVLLFQFHDVLPGSAIGRVYDYTAQRYPQMASTLRILRDKALEALLAAVAPPAAAAVVGDGGATATLTPGGSSTTSATTISSSSSSSSTRPTLRVGEVVGAKPLTAALSTEGAETGFDKYDKDAVTSPGQAPPASTLRLGLGTGDRFGRGAGARGGPVVGWVFNSLAFRRREVVSVPVEMLPPGMAVRQLSDDGTAALVVVDAPPLSITRLLTEDLLTGYGNSTAAEDSAAAAAASAIGGDPWGYVGATLLCGTNHKGRVEYVMQNSLIRAVFDSAGRLVSLYDIAWRRELVPDSAAGNVFMLYEDIPLFWDAWDIEVYHLEKGSPAGRGLPPPKVTILEYGPVRCRLGVEAQLTQGSSIRQTISLTAVSARLDFHCEIVWAENRTALKVEFPWLLDAPAASYEVQYGAVERPTHTNTSWDWARFEVCAHKWADLSEPGYGVALLNDCKYGHATYGNVMRLTLLRSPKAPDRLTDMGTHVLRYALLPHALGWAAAGVPAHGWAFNAPLRVIRPPPQRQQTPPAAAVAAAAAGPGITRTRVAAGPAYDPTQPMFCITSAGPNPLFAAAAPPGPLSPPPLILDTIKLPEPPLQTLTKKHMQTPVCTTQPPQLPPPGPNAALSPLEDETPAAGALVLRLYEPHGARGIGRLRWPSWLRVSHVKTCNLLEDDQEEDAETVVQWGDAGGSIDVPYGPYKVITLKLYLEQEGVRAVSG